MHNEPHFAATPEHASAETAPPRNDIRVDRRSFLGTGAGLTLAFALPAASGDAQAAASTAVSNAVNTWLTIGSDETITLTIGSSDMGQGSFAGLAQILAEDLGVNPLTVKLVQGAPTMANPAPIGCAINTVGSGVTRNNLWRLRDAAAIAREMLVKSAMIQMGERSRDNFTVDNGVVRHVRGRYMTYGMLAAMAATLPPPASAALVPASGFLSIGRTLQRPDIPLKVNGSAVYGIDVRLPGMVYAVIKHCPTLGGMLASTPAVPSGLIAVVPTRVAATTGRGLEAVGNINAVAVVGATTWDAWQGAKRVNPSWTLPANAALLNTAQFTADAQALLSAATPYTAAGPNPPGTLYTVEASTASAATALAGAARVIDATYSLPYVAHACLEVLNCTVDYVAGVRCDVWAPTQSARTALALVISLTGLTAAQVTIHTTFLGGGLGRKAEVDFIGQAVQVGMALGRPVKLMWPREEDFAHDQYRPMALVRVRGGLDANNQVAAWMYRNVSPSILGQRGSVLGARGDSQGYEASQDLPYNFGARLVEWVSHTAGVPVGFWRSVGASINTFAVESMIDELAAAAGEDPAYFRRQRLTDPRWLAVLDLAIANSNWTTPLPAGSGRGIAIGTAFNSIVAEVVEVSNVTATSMKINKVTVVLDAYMVVNPGSVEMQLVGGVVHGINSALYGKQTFANGAAVTKNFNTSRMIRANEMPAVKVVLVPNPAVPDRTVPIGGVGELGVPTFAPALANAVFKATGNRVRTLPFFPNATMSDG
jgi:isoquinoline 1-oxidoreductase beta subunit